MREELAAVRRDFRGLVGHAGRAALRRRSDGTRRTNRQLLFHMLFGYLLVRALLILMGMSARLPSGAGRGLLDSVQAPLVF